MALAAYLASVQRLLGTGSTQNLYSDVDLTAYINEARNQVAMEGQCIRALPPISGPITAITVVSGGVGYSTPRVVITKPDFPSGLPPTPSGAQATATANSGTSLTTITMQSQGAGYFSPVITFSGLGQGAVVVATISGINQTVVGQEVYRFSDVNGMVAVSGSGIQSIFMVNGIAMLYASSRYTLRRESFQKYQSLDRNFAYQFQYVPAVFAQFGQGNAGSVYLYPVPSQNYQMEWDTCCLPIPLVTDADIEAIPPPWTDCVKFFAAYQAFQGAQRFADADRMMGQYEIFMKRARAFVSSRSVSNWYGRSPG